MTLLIEKPAPLCRDHVLLRIRHDGKEALPGQFINIKPCKGSDPLLRRPFSVHNMRDGIMEIVVKVIGRGTAIISGMEPGEIDILGPLGRGFSLVERGRVLIAGGGAGNAPLYFLGNRLKELGNEVTFLYGARTKDFIYLEDDYSRMADDFILCTDDGSAGRRGTVSDSAKKILAGEGFSRIYACGPTPMMADLARMTGHLPLEVSVETFFGCGIGLCMGCTIETNNGLKRACADGPVFDGSTILWERIVT